ncbi:MAG: hypothetical protein ACKVVP_08800 [Chloroflexota bacterium]
MAFTVTYIRSKAVVFRDFAAGDLNDWVQALNWIEQNLGGDALLLGHSPAVVTKDALRETRQYLLDLKSAVTSARTAGHADNAGGMIAAVKAELALEYASFSNFENFLPPNIAGAMRSMVGQQVPDGGWESG